MENKSKKIMLTRDRSAFSTKWVCNFASQLVERGYEVDLVCNTFFKEGEPAPIDERVKKINLNAKTKCVFRNIWRVLREGLGLSPILFNKFIKKEKPDLIVCYFLRDLFNVSFLQKHNIPIIMMMHNPPVEVFAKQFKNPIKKWIYRKLLQRVAVIQVLMPDFVEQMKIETPNKPIVVIPNQVYQHQTIRNLAEEKKVIMHVAQIALGKRQHLLLEAFAKIAPEFPDWEVRFYGKVKPITRHKKYFQGLIDFAQKNNMAKQVKFMGFCKNINAEYMQADINVLPSPSEGFGYGLADGLAMGIPGMGYQDAWAINELIINEKNGFLVKDVDDFADKLKTLMSNKNLRIKQGLAAHLDMQRFAPNVVMQKWVDLIEETLKAN